MKKIYFLWSLLGLLALQLVWAQTNITGTVLDETGSPLPGATVVVDGTSRGVATDFDWNFSIQASQGETLLITYVGYADQRVTVGNQDNYIVNLSLDNELEEVVITGVAAIINESRVSTGGLAPATDGDTDLLDKLFYERYLEAYEGPGNPFFDRRRTDDLGNKQFRHFPVPARNLNAWEAPLYTTGGE